MIIKKLKSLKTIIEFNRFLLTINGNLKFSIEENFKKIHPSDFFTFTKFIKFVYHNNNSSNSCYPREFIKILNHQKINDFLKNFNSLLLNNEILLDKEQKEKENFFSMLYLGLPCKNKIKSELKLYHQIKYCIEEIFFIKFKVLGFDYSINYIQKISKEAQKMIFLFLYSIFKKVFFMIKDKRYDIMENYAIQITTSYLNKFAEEQFFFSKITENLKNDISELEKFSIRLEKFFKQNEKTVEIFINAIFARDDNIREVTATTPNIVNIQQNGIILLNKVGWPLGINLLARFNSLLLHHYNFTANRDLFGTAILLLMKRNGEALKILIEKKDSTKNKTKNIQFFLQQMSTTILYTGNVHIVHIFCKTMISCLYTVKIAHFFQKTLLNLYGQVCKKCMNYDTIFFNSVVILFKTFSAINGQFENSIPLVGFSNIFEKKINYYNREKVVSSALSVISWYIQSESKIPEFKEIMKNLLKNYKNCDFPSEVSIYLGFINGIYVIKGENIQKFGLLKKMIIELNKSLSNNLFKYLKLQKMLIGFIILENDPKIFDIIIKMFPGISWFIAFLKYDYKPFGFDFIKKSVLGKNFLFVERMFAFFYRNKNPKALEFLNKSPRCLLNIQTSYKDYGPIFDNNSAFDRDIFMMLQNFFIYKKIPL